MDASNSYNATLDLRFGHGDGFTDIIFTPDTANLLTGGIDGECRLWNFKDGQLADDAVESYSACDAIYGIACTKDKFFVASESTDVKSYDISNGNYEGSVVRFSAEVYCITISPKLSTVAAGSADFSIKLVDLKDNSFKALEGHEAPVLSLAFEPSGKLLASSSCDGTIRIWNVESGSEEFKWSKNHAMTSDLCYSSTQARMSWNPAEKCTLAIPSNEQIKLFRQEETSNNWKLLASTQPKPSLIPVASLTSFSSSGTLLALACGVTGNIAIWHSKSLSSPPLAVMVRQESISVTALLFHPKDEAVLVFADKNGKYGLLKIENSSSHRENLDSLVDDLYSRDKESTEQSESQIHVKAQCQKVKENEGRGEEGETHELTNDVDMTEMTSENISKNEASSTKKKQEKSIHDEDDSDSDSEDEDEPIIKRSSRRRTAFIEDEAGEKNATEGESDEETANDAIDAADFINDDVEEEDEEVDEKAQEEKSSTKGPAKGKDNEDEEDFDDGSTFNEEDMIAALADIEPPTSSKSTNAASAPKSDVKDSTGTGDVDAGDVDVAFDDDLNVTDIGALKAQYEKLINPDEEDEPGASGSNVNGTNNKLTSESAKMVKVDSYTQPPFQPGSTPVGSESRFMLWNDIGIVKAYTTENSAEDTIEVVFHDHAIHHSINLNNSLNYTIAALSAESFVLATQYDEMAVGDDANSSKLLCMNFTTWDEANKEWRISLPDDEFVEALAIGTGFIAVVSDKRFLRLFTLGGVQTFILSIPGNVVCLSAAENSLMVVYNSAAGASKNNPFLSAHLVKVNAKSALPAKQPMSNPVAVALSPDSTLYWAGFTDEGTPCIVDTSGVVRLLKPLFGNCWMPIVDMKEDLTNKCDNYFVISVSEISQNVRCLFCKGSRYPSMFPYPTLTNVPFVLPFISRGSTKGSLEERAGRAKLFSGLLERLLIEGKDVESSLQANYRAQNEALLRLFALALTNNCESLALEIAYLMPTGQAVDSAVRYAVGKRCMALAEKLRQVALEKDDEVAEFEQEQNQNTPQVDSYHVSPKKSVVPEITNEHAPVLKPKKVASITQSKEVRGERQHSTAESSSSSSSSSENESDAENQPGTTREGQEHSSNNRMTSKTSRNKHRKQEDNFINDDSSDDGESEDESHLNEEEETASNNKSNGKRKREETAKGSSKGSKATTKNKGPVAANPFEAARNKRKADSTAGFELFFQEKLDVIKDENGIEDETDCRIIARDMFKSLPLSQRNEWEEKAQCKSSKRAKR